MAGKRIVNIGALLINVVSVIGAMFAATLAYRASSRATSVQRAANKTSDRKVDIEEYREQQERYRRMIEDLEKELQRVRAQGERTEIDLRREQETSTALRTEVRLLRDQIDILNRSRGRGTSR